MATWIVEVDFGSGAVDITEHCEQMRRELVAHSDLRPVVNTASFVVNDLDTANSFLTGGNDLTVTITKDGSDWFTGQIRQNFDGVLTSHFESLTIQCVDNTIDLQKRIDSNISWSSYKVCDTSNTSTSIVHQLFVSAGFSLGDLSLTDIDVTLTVYAVDRSERKTYWRELSELLENYGYVFNQQAGGTVELLHLHPTTLSKSYLRDQHIAHPMGTHRQRNRWEAVRCNWHPVQTVNNALVFSDRTGGTDRNSMDVTLDNGDYYPVGSGSDTIYSVYKYPDAEILSVTLPVLIWDKTGTISLVAGGSFGTKKADISFTSTADGSRLLRFDIKGNVTFRDKTKIRKEVVYNVASSERILEFDARFIEAQTYAAQLASDKANYYNYAKLTYDFEIADDDLSVSLLDEFDAIIEAQDLDTDIRIVSLAEDEFGHRFATAEGISAYSLLTSEVQDENTGTSETRDDRFESPDIGDDDIANVELSGFFRSGGGLASSLGSVWHEGTNNFGNAIGGMAITASGVIIAGSNGAEIETSSDDGETFSTDISNNLTGAIRGIRYFDHLDTSFAFDNVGKLIKSTDDGATWSALISNGFATSGSDIWDMDYDPVHDVLVMVGIYDAGVCGTLISDDDGATWSLPSSPLTVDLRGIRYVGSGRLVAQARETRDVFYSDDGGDTWSSAVDVDTDGVTDFALGMAFGKGTLIATWVDTDGTDTYAAYYSVDGGESWTAGTLEDNTSLVGYPQFLTIGFFGSNHISFDNGRTWQLTGADDIAPVLLSAVYSPSAGRIVIGATTNETLYSDWLEAGSGIVEQGSNSNGEYIRFSDGTQVCFQIEEISNLAVTSAGGASLYQSGALSGRTMPANFTEVQYSNIHVMRSANILRWAACDSTTYTTSAWQQFRVLDTSSGSSDTTIGFFAIGSWK